MRLTPRLGALFAAATTCVLVATVGAAAPAQAIPNPVGSYATVAAKVLRTIDSDTCQNMVQFDVAVDLTGLGNAIAAQGYTSPAIGLVYGGTDPVYTKLSWWGTVSITGPDNYYETFDTPGGSTFPEYFPTSVSALTDSVCPDDFGHSRTSPGAYHAEWKVTFAAGSICSKTEKCTTYDPVFTQSGAVDYTFAFSSTCLKARADLKTFKKKLKKAKKRHDRPAVRKFKRKVAGTKSVIAKTC